MIKYTENLPDLRETLRNYLLPLLNIPATYAGSVTDQLLPVSKIRQAVKMQVVEEAGPAGSGHFMLVLQGLLDSLYHCAHSGHIWGRHIYYKQQCIFNPGSLFHGHDRPDSIRALEPSVVLRVPYAAIRLLGEQYDAASSALQTLTIQHERYLYAYMERISLNAPDRVRLFVQTHPTFVNRVPRYICAMHNHLSRKWYSTIINQ